MLAPRYPYYLAGEPVHANEALAVTDKYSGETATHVALASRATVERAFASAEAARPALRAFPPYARKEVLRHCAERFRARGEELARVLAIEAGKPIKDGRGEVARLVETFDIAAEEAVRIQGETVSLESSPRTKGYRSFTKLVPVGVCSFLTPFNFPLNLVAHKVAPAIAAGCPFVLKPSERTPLSALLVGEVLSETDLPHGAFSILPTSLADVGAFIEDPRIRFLSFTGSAKVGWEVKARAGRAKVVLELGGNAACIVDRDQGGDLDQVVDRLVFGGFYQSGQSCISVQRILVHRSLLNGVTERLVARAGALAAGDPKDEATSLGPVIDVASAERIVGWVERARARGARVLLGGGRNRSLVEATVLTDVPHDEPIWAEEVFGPVVLLEAWDHFGDAVALANASPYGLQTGVFTHDLRRAMEAWDELEVGGVVVGDVPSFRADSMPYGGVKGSGLGREGVKHAIREMCETRLLVLKA